MCSRDRGPSATSWFRLKESGFTTNGQPPRLVPLQNASEVEAKRGLGWGPSGTAALAHPKNVIVACGDQGVEMRNLGRRIETSRGDSKPRFEFWISNSMTSHLGLEKKRGRNGAIVNGTRYAYFNNPEMGCTPLARTPRLFPHLTALDGPFRQDDWMRCVRVLRGGGHSETVWHNVWYYRAREPTFGIRWRFCRSDGMLWMGAGRPRNSPHTPHTPNGHCKQQEQVFVTTCFSPVQGSESSLSGGPRAVILQALQLPTGGLYMRPH